MPTKSAKVSTCLSKTSFISPFITTVWAFITNNYITSVFHRFPSQPTDPASPVVVEVFGPVMTSKQNI
jgi:hypothetical protein